MPTVDETRAAIGEPDTRAATDEPEAHTAAPEVQRRPSTAARWQANAWEDYARRLSFAIAAAGPPPSSGARETADAIFSAVWSSRSAEGHTSSDLRRAFANARRALAAVKKKVDESEAALILAEDTHMCDSEASCSSSEDRCKASRIAYELPSVVPGLPDPSRSMGTFVNGRTANDGEVVLIGGVILDELSLRRSTSPRGHSTSPGDQRAPAYRRSTAPSPSPSARRENAARHRSEVERNKRQNEVARIQRQQTESRTKVCAETSLAAEDKAARRDAAVSSSLRPPSPVPQDCRLLDGIQLHIPVPFDIPSTDSPIPIDLPIPISTPILTESPTGAISPTLSELPLFDDVLRDGSLLYPTSPFPTSQDVGSLSPATSVVSVFRDVAPGNASSDVQLSVENPTPPLTEERPPSQPAAQPLRSGLPYFSRELDAWAAKQEKPPPSKSYQPNLPLKRQGVPGDAPATISVAKPSIIHLVRPAGRHKVSNKTASYSAVATPNSARQARTVDSSSKQRLSTSRPTVGSMILADLPIQAVSAGRLTFADLGAGYRLRPNPGQMYSPNPGLTSDFATEQTCDSDDSFDSLFDEITDQNVQGPSTSGILARDDIGVGRRRKASLDNILQVGVQRPAKRIRMQ